MRRLNAGVSSIALLVLLPVYALRTLGIGLVDDAANSGWIISGLPLFPIFYLIFPPDESSLPLLRMIGPAMVRSGFLEDPKQISAYLGSWFAFSSAFSSRYLDSWAASFYGSALTTGLALLT